MARQYPAKKGAPQPATANVDPDMEDENEPPETPGETPDAEDVAEGHEQDDGDGADTEGHAEDAAEGGEQDDNSPNVTPDEQKIYDAVITAAMQMMFQPKALQTIVQKLQNGAQDISGAIGHTAAMIMQSVRGTSIGNKQPIPDDVTYAAGQEVIGDLCDIAIAAKIFPEQGKAQIASAALFEGMRVWGATMKNRGQITPQAQAQAQSDLKAHGIKQAAPAAQSQSAAGPAQAQTSPPPPGVGAPPSPPGPQAVAAQQGIVNSGAGQ